MLDSIRQKINDFHLIRKSGLFAYRWYYNQNQKIYKQVSSSIWWPWRDTNIIPLNLIARIWPHPIWHYLANYQILKLDPNPFFSSQLYLQQNPDVKSLRMNPLIHHLRHGQYENRRYPASHLFWQYHKVLNKLGVKDYSLDIQGSNFTFGEPKPDKIDKPKIAVQLHLPHWSKI